MTSLNQAIDLADALQKKLCKYNGPRCDCKYLDSPCGSSERTGCCEARQLKEFLEALKPAPLTGGAYLADLRKSRGLTIRDVEIATGISNATISQYETGSNTNPSFYNMQTLAKFYKQDFREFGERFSGQVIE